MPICAADPVLQAAVSRQVDDLASQGQRVLAVAFRLVNKGRMHHELVVFAAREGVSAAQMMATTTPEERRALADPPVGVIFAPTSRPESAELLATLESGRWYILFCAIRDSAGMPPHFMIGMVDSVYAR
jgi:hypothetical protein